MDFEQDHNHDLKNVLVLGKKNVCMEDGQTRITVN